METLREYESKAIHDFTTRDIASFNDGQITAFGYSIRGKLQVLRDLIKLLEDAELNKELLIKELNQFKDLEA